MNLSKATPEQIAAELTARGMAFMLITDDGDRMHVYSPPQIDGAADKRSYGMFKMIRDYCNHLEVHDALDERV